MKPAAHAYFLALTLILTTYQLIRVIVFVNVYGGVEHDGGWMLTISRSLAEQGTYTTLVSTLPDPLVLGGMNVDQKFDIQAPDGRVWFFTGNGIGPASIVPDALILKLCGFGFWALRAGPLMFYVLFLLVAAYSLYRLAGLGAVLLFHAFLFFYPHLSIFLSYEAMGEVPTMVYILWAYLAFAAARRRRDFFVAGLIAGLAVNAKLIGLWSVAGIFLWAGLRLLASVSPHPSPLPQGEGTRIKLPAPFGDRRKGAGDQREEGLRQLLLLAGGAVVVPLLWEGVHLVVLTWLAGFDLYLKNAMQRVSFILDDGSGVGLQIHAGPEFWADKFFLLSEVAHPERWVTALIFGAMLLGGPVLLWLWRGQSYRQTLLASLWWGWLVNTAWFVSLAKTGWPRHFWFGLVLAALLLAVLPVALLRQGRGPLPSLLGVALLGLMGWGFARQPHVGGFFLPDEIVPYWQEKQIQNKYHASLPWIIIPRADQAAVVAYIRQMPPDAHVYYPGGHKSAELPAQTGRIHYPFSRRNYPGTVPHPDDVVLISPSLISPWLEPGRRRDLLDLVERECPRPALKNDFYRICPVEAQR
jgi:hypothetical protein